MLSDEWLPRYRLLENFTAKWNGNGNGNGNAYDRGDYNSSFALRAVELKSRITVNEIQNSVKACRICGIKLIYTSMSLDQYILATGKLQKQANKSQNFYKSIHTKK